MVRSYLPITHGHATRYGYRFSRYRAIPEIIAMPEVAGGQAVRLIELSRRVLDAHLTSEQQAQRYQRARANGELAVAASVKFYIPFIAEQTGQLTPRIT